MTTTDHAPTTISEWQRRVGEVNVANGWRDATPETYADPTKQIATLALITTEVAEAIEEVRNGHSPSETYYAGQSDPAKPEGVPSEIADVVIRCLDFADLYGIDLEAMIAEKIAYNGTRGHRHGGKVL